MVTISEFAGSNAADPVRQARFHQDPAERLRPCHTGGGKGP
ncbi:hypothetical protein ACIBQ1_33575 [Nonomuraea sp. NPDC050153]